MVGVVGFVQGRFHYSAAGVAGVDEIAVSCVNADVGDAVAIGVFEEYKVAGREMGLVY